MKAAFVLTTISLALPLCAQVATTGSRPATTGAGPFATGVGTATTGTQPRMTGPGFGTPSGVVPAAGAPTIAGPAGAGTVNVGPAGAGAPVGNTFSRPNMTPPLTPGTPDLNSPAAAVGFPQANTTVQPLVTNTGIGGFTGDSAFTPPEAATFPPGGPVSVNNTVGQNFAPPFTNFPPRRALSVNLPPGAMVQPPVPGGAAPALPPPPAVGGPMGPQSGSVAPNVAPPVGTPAPQLPPPNAGARIPRVVR